MAFLIPACALLMTVPQEGAVELRWKFRAGQELRYEVAQQTTTQIRGMSQDQTTTTTYLWKVENLAEDGTATVRMKYESLRVKASGLQEFEYDSRKDKEPPANQSVQIQSKLVGQSFTLKMTPAGRVKEVKGFDKILDRMLEDQPEEQRELARGMLEQMFTGKTMESMFQQMTPALPEKKVSVGDTWKSGFTFRLPMLGSLKFDIASRLVEVKDGRAAIDQVMSVGVEEDDEGFPGLFQITKAKGTTSSVFSIDQGLFLSSKTSMNMTMIAGDQEIPLKSVTRLKLVRNRSEF